MPHLSKFSLLNFLIFLSLVLSLYFLLFSTQIFLSPTNLIEKTSSISNVDSSLEIY